MFVKFSLSKDLLKILAIAKCTSSPKPSFTQIISKFVAFVKLYCFFIVLLWIPATYIVEKFLIQLRCIYVLRPYCTGRVFHWKKNFENYGSMKIHTVTIYDI